MTMTKHGMRKKARRQVPKLLKKQGNVCAECGKPMRLDLIGKSIMVPDRVTVDHKISLGHGGNSDLDNLELVHLACNQKRNKRLSPKIKVFCRHCGKTKPDEYRRSCKECRKAYNFLYAGVGIS